MVEIEGSTELQRHRWVALMFDKIDYSNLGPRQSIVKPGARSRGPLIVCLSGLTLAVGIAWALYVVQFSPPLPGPPGPPATLALPIPAPGAEGPELGLLCGIEPLVAVDFFKQGKSDEKDRFGISLRKCDDPAFPGAKKRLFQDSFGATNNTRIDLNGYQFVFGNKYANATYQKDAKTRQILRDFDISSTLRRPMRGWLSKVQYQAETSLIEVSQEIRLIPGSTNRLDTVLVRYTVMNIGKGGCTVALRTLLDTYNGGTDGMPFYVPRVEREPGHWVDKMEVLRYQEIPCDLHILESTDLTDPHSVHAVLGLRPGNTEEPAKCVICRAPNQKDGDAGWGSEEPKENDWAYQPMGEPADAPKDSCVVLYWEKRNMAANEKRTFGYTYGLGRKNDRDDPNTTVAVAREKQMALYVQRGSEQGILEVTAFLKEATNERVTLRLPPTVEFLEGEIATKTAEEPVLDRTALTWRVRVLQSGQHLFAADAPGIGRATTSIRARPPDPGCRF